MIYFTGALILNALLAAASLVVSLVRHRTRDAADRRGFYIRTAVFLLCPVAGPLYYLGCYGLTRLRLRRGCRLNAQLRQKNAAPHEIQSDAERERDIISLEEALAVSDPATLRTLIFNAVQGELDNVCATLKLALGSSDSETAHYAASALQDARSEFRTNMQNMRYTLDMEASGSRSDNGKLLRQASKYLDYLLEILRYQAFDEFGRDMILEQMEKTAEFLYKLNPDFITRAQYEAVCTQLLDAGNANACETWCARLNQQYPGTLSAYSCRIRLYFVKKRGDAFFAALQELRDSNIEVDHEMLELLRLFQ